MNYPDKITIESKTYNCPKTIKAKGKRLRAKDGYILIQAKDWSVPSQFKYPNPRYKVSGTDKHPVLTVDNKF